MEVPKYCTAKLLEELKISETWKQLVPQILSTLFCLLGLPFMYIACHSFEKKYVPKSLKFLLYFHHIALFVYAISYILTQSYHLITRIFFNDCDLLVSAKHCVIIRLFQSCSSSFFQNFYIVVIINSFLNCFKFYKVGYARLLGWAALLIAFAGTFPSYFVDAKSEEYMLNCSSFEHKTKAVQIEIFMTLLSVDVISAIIFTLMKCYRNRQLNDPSLKYSIGRLQRTKELERVIVLIGPNLALHLICYIWLYAVSLFATAEDKLNGNLFIWANSIPIYICLSPIVWVKTLQKYQASVVPAPSNQEAYFRTLDEFWNYRGLKKRKLIAEYRRKIDKNKNNVEPSVSLAVVDTESSATVSVVP